MTHRLPQLPDELREPHTVESPGLWRLYFIAIGVAALLGVLSGAVWIAWRLLRIHVFP
jgi:hypothetical protein